ncbi:protein kinase family protein [Blastococcus sp. SYSU D00820]
MTSTITGLPDRYRPLDEVGPEETTATGVIRCWRAKDRVLNRDVAIRVHTPGGPAARDWIARALTAGGLATPALAMVYDAAEGTGDAASAAYVVNEWIEGQTLAERLAAGPMDEREARTVLRRLAEGVAEAHRVGLAVGGLSPDTVVLRPNGLVGLRAVPAASGTMQGDIAALGELLEGCLTGHRPGGTAGRPPAIVQPDLAALVRRARSSEPGTGLASAAAMAALLAERPRSASTYAAQPVRGTGESDSGWLRRLRERAEDDDRGDAPVDDDPAPTQAGGGPRRLDPAALPPVPPARAGEELLPLDDEDDGSAPAGDEEEATPGRRKLLVVGLPLAALVVVVLLAWWVGSNLLSVADSVDGDGTGSTPPSSSVPAQAPETAEPAPGDAPAATIVGAELVDPEGDGADNPEDVPASFDGDPATAWSTVDYFNRPDFGGLKDGMGVRYDLGDPTALAGVTITTNTPGISVEVRTGDLADGDVDSYPVAASGTVDGTAELTFPEPVTARYVLVWITELVPSEGGFAGDLAEIALQPAG